MKTWNVKRLGAASVLLAALLVLTMGNLPVRGAIDEMTGLYGGELRVAVLGSIDLNPFTATSDASWNAIDIAYDSIARIDPVSLTPTLWAAAGWSTSGTQLTVTLRSDLAFHDGTAVTAADVIYSYTEYKALGMVPADLTVSGSGTQVTFDTALGGLFFGEDLTLPIVKSGTGLTNAAVGSGPYVPVTTTMPVSLDANVDHFQPPLLSTVSFHSYTDTPSASADMLRGNLDFIGWSLGVDEPSAIIDVDGTNMSLINDASLYKNPGLTHLVVGFNVAAGRATGDEELRLALAKTLNPVLYEQIHPDTDRSRTLIIDENQPWFNPNVELYQVTIAIIAGRSSALLTSSNQRLDSAGYLDTNGDGIREMPDGSSFQLNIVGAPVGESARIFTIQDSIRDVFSRIGVNVNLETVASVDLPARLASGNFDVFVAQMDTTLDPAFLSAYYHSTGGLNYVGFSDAAVDSALEAADAALDMVGRQENISAVQQAVMSEGVLIPVLHFDAIHSTVRGTFDDWTEMPGGINNFWSYMTVHKAQVGSLDARVSVVPVSATSGGSVTALVTTVDQLGAPVADVSVRVLAGGSVVASGTTGAAGTLSVSFSAPTVAGTTDMSVVAEATKTGYVGDRATTSMTVRPALGTLVVTVASDQVSIGPDDSATITVTVKDGAAVAVSGAAVSLQLSGRGGELAASKGTTGSGGTFTTTLTADVGVRTLFRIDATASKAGFTDDSGSTSVLAEQRVGAVEPRAPPFFDISAIIAGIVILVILVVWLGFFRKK
ncbi:MAG: hypothetical protein GTO63_34960 [Anaerolineae bacterium]|nr:hypothetical protein [Anaerolineae bacterium]NIN99897.1 hypothetical protein [Anaerolineae bacterium]